MIQRVPNNNLSVLPWYGSIEEQNARRWWVYGKVYPLFAPVGQLPPFQIMREPLREPIEPTYEDEHRVLLADGSTYEDWDVTYDYTVAEFPVDFRRLLLRDIPAAPIIAGQDTVMAVAFDGVGTVLGTFSPILSGRYTGYWDLPAGTEKVSVLTEPGASEVSSLNEPLKPLQGAIELITREGTVIDAVDVSLLPFFYKSIDGIDIIGLTETIVFNGMAPGQYYCRLGDAANTWYSEVFTAVGDIAPYLKLEWWDRDDFVMDAGAIAYKGVGFRNIVYLPSDIAKPEYIFEEEGETRDGYFFPAKMISEKRYKFSFLASEYLLDVMRLVRMADNVQITKGGKTYLPDTFLLTPEWEDNGDVAAVQAEFECSTVAKKIRFGITGTGAGDFNDDFNNDFNN